MRLKYQIRIYCVCVLCIKIHGNGRYFMRDVLVVVLRKHFLHLLLHFQFSSFIASIQTRTHAHTHMNYQSLAAFYASTAFIYGYTQNIPLGCRRLKLYCSRHGLYQRAPENYSANFHFFCLKKQCNCFRVFNDTAHHIAFVQLVQHRMVYTQPPLSG